MENSQHTSWKSSLPKTSSSSVMSRTSSSSSSRNTSTSANSRTPLGNVSGTYLNTTTSSNMMMPGNNGYRARQQPVNDSGIDEAASHLGDTDVDLSPLTDHSHGRSFEEVEGSQNSLPNYDTVPSSVPHENHNVPNTSQGAGAAAAATTLNAPPEWEDLAPDVVIRCIKKIPAQELATIGMREYYKSYPVWQRMTVDQRNRAIAWFRQLPEDWQGKYLVMARFVLACISSICAHILIICFPEKIISDAIDSSEQLAQEEAAAKVTTTKDDIARLIHLFKEPAAQTHWTNLYSVLSRADLDARKSADVYSEGANPLEHLAEIFNNYETFRPQNVMVKYVDNGSSRPVKKIPYVASCTDWTYLASFTHEVDPCNLSRSQIIRGPDWIKTTWADCRKYLHQMFTQYNRSGEHDPEKDEWMSEKENRRWARAAGWKSPGTNNVVRHQQAMIYSIAVLDISDFDGIGRKMPRGTGVDASINDGSISNRHKTRKHGSKKEKVKKKIKADDSSTIAKAISEGNAYEAKMQALRILMEFGSATEKIKAREELCSIAYGGARTEMDEDNGNDSSSDEE